jgi:NTP pyrophosphatase (non-canonical NTP hydrolase)
VIITDLNAAIGDVIRERNRQDEKWGPSENRPAPSLRILAEEFGEVAKAMQDEPDDALRTELIQVAAVAVAMVEAIDRGDVPRQ